MQCALPMEFIESMKFLGITEYAGGAQAMRPTSVFHGGFRDWQLLKSPCIIQITLIPSKTAECNDWHGSFLLLVSKN
jgi:hypothetical protein